MHVLGTGVPRRLGVARSASSSKAVQALGCSPTPGLRILFGRVTCMARAASVPGLWTRGFLLLFRACVWVWVVFGLGFRLRPATPGWGDGVCVCLRARSAHTAPFLAGLCGVGVCAWARVSAAPRHSWLGCWVRCVLVCPLRLYPATPGWGVRRGRVCLGSVFRSASPLLAGVLGCACLCATSAFTPPLLAGVCGVGVCAWARVSAAPRHSWLGCAAWVCVLGLGFRLRPATPGWGVGVLCVLLCALRLYLATPGWGVRCGRVCLGSGLGCAPPLLAGALGVRVCVCTPLVPRHSWLGCAVWACVLGLGFRLRPATPGWAVRCGCVSLGSGFSCAPPLLDGVLGFVCACVCAPLVPRHSWLGCAVWVCVLGLGFRLHPTNPGGGVGVLCVLACALRLYLASPGWGVRCGCLCLGSGFGCAPPLLAGVLGCACLCARSACTPPLLAGLCGVGVCPWARVSAAPGHSWLG